MCYVNSGTSTIHKDSYFTHVIQNLSFREITLLGVLYDQDATLPFKSLSRKELQEESKLSTSTFKKTLYSLHSMKFIGIVSSDKPHTVFLTDYGEEAMYHILEEESD